MTDRTVEILNSERSTYPGHPLTIAWVIVNVFPSLAAAQDREGRTFPAALESQDVPGAGGRVYAALDFLATALAGRWDDAVKRADDVWSSEAALFRDTTGKDQAARIAPMLRAKLETWR